MKQKQAQHMSKLMSEKPEIAESAIITHSKFGKYCSVGANTRFCYSELGDFSYISVNSNIFSTKIGKFASLSWNVSVNPANHDYNRFTQHPMLFAAKYGMLPDNKPYYRQYGETSIGNDVWIGCNTLIMGGGNYRRRSHHRCRNTNFAQRSAILNCCRQQPTFEKSVLR